MGIPGSEATKDCDGSNGDPEQDRPGLRPSAKERRTNAAHDSQQRRQTAADGEPEECQHPEVGASALVGHDLTTRSSWVSEGAP